MHAVRIQTVRKVMWNVNDMIYSQHCLTQPVFSSDSLLDLSCSLEPQTNGVLHDIFSSSTIAINQTSPTTVHLEVMNSYYPSLSTTPLVCDYSECALMSSIECSTFISGYYNCLMCNTTQCSVQTNTHLHLYPDAVFLNDTSLGVPFYQQTAILHPFLSLYTRNTSHLFSPSVFGCKEDGFCKWIHVLFSF